MRISDWSSDVCSSDLFTGSGYIQTIVSDEVRAFAQRYREVPELPVDLALRVRFNPQLNKSWFGAIMQVINNVTMLSIVLTGAALIREREHGTVEHLLVMPEIGRASGRERVCQYV